MLQVWMLCVSRCLPEFWDLTSQTWWRFFSNVSEMTAGWSEMVGNTTVSHYLSGVVLYWHSTITKTVYRTHQLVCLCECECVCVCVCVCVCDVSCLFIVNWRLCSPCTIPIHKPMDSTHWQEQQLVWHVGTSCRRSPESVDRLCLSSFLSSSPVWRTPCPPSDRGLPPHSPLSSRSMV